MDIQKGTKVRIIGGGDGGYHYFKTGDIVEFAGDTVVGACFRGTVYDFDSGFPRNPEEDTQFLLPSHYEVVEDMKIVEVVVDASLPTKVVYAVLNKHDEVLYTTHNRDTAREMKAVYGGKKKGVRIFQYAATKEIR